MPYQSRDTWLIARGFAVLRFANGDIRRNLDGVCEVIFATLKERCLVANLIAEVAAGTRYKLKVERFFGNPGARAALSVRVGANVHPNLAIETRQ